MPDTPFPRSLAARLSLDEYRRRLALMLVQGGLNTSPIQSPWQGAARMAQAFMGGLLTRNLQDAPQQAVGPLANAQGAAVRAPTTSPTPPPAVSTPTPTRAPNVSAGEEGSAPPIDAPVPARPGRPQLLTRSAAMPPNEQQLAYIQELLENPETRELGWQLQRAHLARFTPGE
jgi:hypothetical protein